MLKVSQSNLTWDLLIHALLFYTLSFARAPTVSYFRLGAFIFISPSCNNSGFSGTTGSPVVISPMLSLKPTGRALEFCLIYPDDGFKVLYPFLVTPTIKPVVSSQAKTVVVTSSSEVLRKQLEECQRALERMAQELKQKDEEIERLKKLNEDKASQS